MNLLIGTGLVLLIIGVGAWRLVKWGRKLQRGKQDAVNVEIKDKQLKAAAAAPRTRAEFIKFLRRKHRK